MLSAIREGSDVYLFLLGMIALAELAGTQHVFDWLAQSLPEWTRSSGARLFITVYLAGVIVTAFLSNDATILLLMPAALAVARRTGTPPIPLAYAVAFVSNAASFLLPFSNPANLLLYPHLPTPPAWLREFGLPSLAAVAITGLILFFWFRREIRAGNGAQHNDVVEADAGMKVTAIVVTLSCIALVAAASAGLAVGATAFGCAILSLAVVSIWKRNAAPIVLREGQWWIVPFVAVLFVAVSFVDRLGAVALARAGIAHAQHFGAPASALVTGFSVALLANAINNLPAAVLAHFAASGNPFVLLAIDAGPNFALSGSLATLLWLAILRKNGFRPSAWQFTRIGLLTTVPALAAALLCTI